MSIVQVKSNQKIDFVCCHIIGNLGGRGGSDDLRAAKRSVQQYLSVAVNLNLILTVPCVAFKSPVCVAHLSNTTCQTLYATSIHSVFPFITDTYLSPNLVPIRINEHPFLLVVGQRQKFNGKCMCNTRPTKEDQHVMSHIHIFYIK